MNWSSGIGTKWMLIIYILCLSAFIDESCKLSVRVVKKEHVAVFYAALGDKVAWKSNTTLHYLQVQQNASSHPAKA